MSTSEMDTFETDEMQEILGDFLVESNELVASLDENFVRLEETPDDPNLLNEVFRAAHTIKGTSGFLALDDVTSLTHKMEDVLNRLRKGELTINGDIMDVLLESVDNLKVLLADVAEGKKINRDFDGIKARLGAIADGLLTTERTKDEPAAESSEGEAAAEESAEEEEKPSSDKDKASSAAHKEKETIRVDVARLDNLMNLMGELVLGRNALLQVTGEFTRRHENLTDLDGLNRVGTQINFITSEIQLTVMKMRMLPIGKVFSKFPRLVRDLARESGKKIDLVMQGEETELDKSIIEAIGDPLVHLIRNSCDHGIESPADRLARGKPETGTIRLSAGQEGSNIVISIEDDGHGLDIEAIKKKAVDRGLATADEVDRMSPREIFNFIFLAGFSTAKKVTDISGRGVGMDVVRTNVEKLKGIIDITSTAGVGTTVSIKLPLTLAILQGLLVTSEEETYVIPLVSVLETLRVSAEEISSVNRRPVITLRDGVLPIVHLNGVLKNRSVKKYNTDKPYVVVVGMADKRLGLIVDDLLGQEEVVIKSMGQMLGKSKGLAGATILGDGRVRLIVDLLGLFNLANN